MTAEYRRKLPTIPQYKNIEHIHVIGICGTAMGSLAAMLKELGYTVTGSDTMAYPPMSTWLEERGFQILDGYRPEHIGTDVDLVVVGNVARVTNVEATAATERQIPMLSLPEVLRTLFFPGHDVLCVTGTHGKTTTSSMLAWILEESGENPSFFIGGVTNNFDSNYKLGSGSPFVIEGDEYDTAYFDKVPKFWHYPAVAATINNIEFDHVDIYKSIDEIEHVFTRFAAQLPDDGELWFNGDDILASRCATHASAPAHSFGLGSHNLLRAEDITHTPEGSMTFTLIYDDEPIAPVSIPMPGRYNIRNFLGAAALAHHQGVGFEQSAAAITGFKGVRKRQEIVGVVDSITVIDDFAHHPTAVSHALAAIRARYPDQKIWAIFEAKSNTSRRSTFQDQYPQSFTAADEVIVSPPWKEDNLPDSEKISIPTLIADIQEFGVPATSQPDVGAIVEKLAKQAKTGDIIVGLSGSAFDGLHQRIIEKLQRRNNR